jgi:hypothetical protein
MHCHLKTFPTASTKWKLLAWSKNVLFQAAPIEMSPAFECSHQLFKLCRTFYEIKCPLSLQCDYINFMRSQSYGYSCMWHERRNSLLIRTTYYLCVPLITQADTSLSLCVWCLITGCLGKYLDLRMMKWQKSGENCVRHSIVCSLHQNY